MQKMNLIHTIRSTSRRCATGVRRVLGARAIACSAALTATLIANPAQADLSLLGDGALFVATNSSNRTTGNEIAMYRRDRKTGDLSLLGFFPTGELARGGPQLGAGPGPTSTLFGLPPTADGHGSSDSLSMGLGNRCLFAVNAGSDSVSAFRVRPGGLELIQVVPSRGTGTAGFPNSLAEKDGVLYVLNAGGTASLVGFDIQLDCGLELIAGSTRDLRDITDSFLIPPPVELLTSPAQIRFSPSGRRLVLTIKGNDVPPGTSLPPSGRMAVFAVSRDAKLGNPTVTPFDSVTARGGPFSFRFIGEDDILVTHGNTQSVGTYRIQPDGRLLLTSGPFRTAAFAPCWLDVTRSFAYVINFGDMPAFGAAPEDTNGSIEGFRIKADGTVEPSGMLIDYPVPGPGMSSNHGIDVRIIGGFLYFVQPRTGKIGRYRIQPDGRLTGFAEFGGFGPGAEPFDGFNPGINRFTERCFLQDPATESPECKLGSPQDLVGF